jgi:hypothetical protein
MVAAVSRRDAIATYRAFFGLLALAAVATQFADAASRGVLDPVHFLSYFTIESNLFAAAVLLVLAARRSEDRSSTMDLVRGSAVVYMTVTGIVFSLLLADTKRRHRHSLGERRRAWTTPRLPRYDGPRK